LGLQGHVPPANPKCTVAQPRPKLRIFKSPAAHNRVSDHRPLRSHGTVVFLSRHFLLRAEIRQSTPLRCPAKRIVSGLRAGRACRGRRQSTREKNQRRSEQLHRALDKTKTPGAVSSQWDGTPDGIVSCGPIAATIDFHPTPTQSSHPGPLTDRPGHEDFSNQPKTKKKFAGAARAPSHRRVNCESFLATVRSRARIFRFATLGSRSQQKSKRC